LWFSELPEIMRIEDLNYHLPAGLIAQYPIEPRDKARLLVLKRRGGEMTHTIFSRVGDFLQKGDCLVINDTRVMPARLCGHKEESRGRVEVLLLRRVPGATEEWECLVNRGKRMKTGARLRFAPDLEAEVVGNGTEGKKRLSFEAQGAFEAIIRRIGHVPLPPYIRGGEDEPLDKEGYQTIFARHEGAVAAPTAGLHFTHELVRVLEEKGVAIVPLTLHVGLASFQPIRHEAVEEHRLEPEFFHIPPAAAEAINDARAQGGRVFAVGTTAVRALETVAEEKGKVHAGEGMTDLYIYPGYRFRAIDALITNFHLPRSTLLLLVFAFAGRELTMSAYQAAIAEGYGFYSYGDGMLIM
jgi:S-adenosylmethionine:tRNA ribosyltransferase-isomerase